MNPTPSLSKKRRRGDDTRATKFYAVRTGARPGVYRTWEECQEQTNGFKGANCMTLSSSHFPSPSQVMIKLVLI